MRLVCPNCSAQYEVDEAVIPPDGRDVQCSNCGFAWFQKGAAELHDDEAAADLAPARTAESEATPAETAGIAPSRPDWDPDAGAAAFSVAAEAANMPPPADPEDSDLVETGALPPPLPAGDRRNLDAAVRKILQEEAERETRARHAERGGVETQPELDLPARPAPAPAPQPAQPPAAPPERYADLSAATEDGDDTDEDDSPVSRRSLLPDIEEINSTLRATSERGGDAAAIDAPEAIRRRRGSFRMGFSMALIAAVFALALYVLAPFLASRLPAAAPALSSYAATVDKARLWLDDAMRSSTEAMRSTGNP